MQIDTQESGKPRLIQAVEEAADIAFDQWCEELDVQDAIAAAFSEAEE